MRSMISSAKAAVERNRVVALQRMDNNLLIRNSSRSIQLTGNVAASKGARIV